MAESVLVSDVSDSIPRGEFDAATELDLRVVSLDLGVVSFARHTLELFYSID